MKNTVDSAKVELIKQIGLVQAAALLVGLLYVTGYYINSMFLKNYGIPGLELLRLEYIKIGFVFWLIVCGLIFLPFGAFYLTSKIRSSSELPHYWLGLVGNSLNVIILLGVPVTLAFFATRFEWKYSFQEPLLGFNSFNHSVSFALALLAVLVIVLPAIERLLIKKIQGKALVWVYRLLIEPVRFGGLALAIYLIYRSVTEISWLPLVLGKSVSFFAAVLILGSGLLAAYYWVTFIRKTEGSLMVIPIVMIGVAFFFYLAVASYVYGVYPAIPCNRGGKLPLTQTYLQIKGYDGVFSSARQKGGLTLHGPVYVIEETEDVLYFASKDMGNWFENFVHINAVKKENIKYMVTERISDGFPRTRR